MIVGDSPHRRLNSLTGQWVLVSPHRALRPWQGKKEEAPDDHREAYDPSCYLCPGNERAGGGTNARYKDVFVFDNDYPALLHAQNAAESTPSSDRLFQHESVEGICRVICFSPRHDLTLAQLSREGFLSVIDAWAEQTRELGARYRWVQVFENKGATMGCSNPHPHGQIWASNRLPDIPAMEDVRQAEYKKDTGGILLKDYLSRELDLQQRVVIDTTHWLAVVPYWATWPFETILMPKRHVLRLPDLSSEERADLAVALKQLLVRYDNLYETSFPYSMGWHGAPFGAEDSTHWQLHAHFYPPLLRSASVRKFMVGYEMLAESQRDLTPEQAAESLRGVSQKHYADPLAADV